MWATLAGAERTRRVGEALDAVCMFLPAEGFLSGGGGNLVIIGLKLRAIKPGAALCGGEPLLLLVILFLLMVIQKRHNCLGLHNHITSCSLLLHKTLSRLSNKKLFVMGFIL